MSFTYVSYAGFGGTVSSRKGHLMIATYTIYPSTWTNTGSTFDSTDTISIDFNSTSYCTNYSTTYEPVPDEDALKKALQEQNRMDSIYALLDVKWVHDNRLPPGRCVGSTCQIQRRPAQRRSATAVRNWRRP